MNNQDIGRSLIRAIRNGELETARELINSYGLPYSESSPKGYDLLCDALDNKHSEIAKLLLTSGSEVNSKTYNYKNSSNTPLHFAVINDDIEIIKMLLVRGANINTQNRFGQTPLHKAIENNDQVEIIELLLKHKADINAEDEDRKTPLFKAIENKNLKITKLLLDNGANVKDDPKLLHSATMGECMEIVELLLQHNADVNVKDGCGQTPLFDAIKNNRLEITELLLKHNADVNATDINGNTALLLNVSDYEDCYKYRTDRDSYVNIKRKITKMLLDHGANVDAQTLGGETPLHLAAYKQYSQVVEVLLEYNTNVNVREKKNLETPLHMSARRKNVEICKMLLNKGVDVDAGERNGLTALHIATLKGSNEIVKLLLERGAKIDSKNECNYTPLYFSAQKGYQEIMETLLKSGADINFRDMDGKTALHIASNKGHNEVITTLLEYGCDINSRDKDGKTALHIASQFGHNEVVTTLLEYGCDINSRDKDGKTALHIASHKGHNEVVTTLLEYGSDINIMTYNDLTPLDYARTVETIEILRRHIVQMKTANLYVNQQNLRSVDEISYRNFQEKCENEITSMKSEKMNNYNISFYDILTKNTDSLAICLRNENIVQILKLDDYKTKFPIYGSMMNIRFRNCMKRNELLDQVNKILHFLYSFFANHRQLPQESIGNIISYLSNEDLKIIIKKSKDK